LNRYLMEADVRNSKPLGRGPKRTLQIPILATLAFHDTDDHALAVDVADLQPRYLGATHAGTIENHQQGAPEQVPAGVDQACNFFLAQNAGQPLTLSWIGKKLTKLRALQRAHVQESQCSNMVDHASDGQLPLLEQIGLISSQMIQAKLVR